MNKKSVFNNLTYILSLILIVANIILLSVEIKEFFIWISLATIAVHLLFLFVFWYLGENIETMNSLITIALVALFLVITLKFFEAKTFVYVLVGIPLGILFIFIQVRNFVIFGRVTSFNEKGSLIVSEERSNQKAINKSKTKENLIGWIFGAIFLVGLVVFDLLIDSTTLKIIISISVGLVFAVFGVIISDNSK